MSLLLLGANQTPNLQQLFSNNEQGLAFDIGDIFGASDGKRTWRRNLLTYSEQLDNAAWVKAKGSAVSNTITAPDGSSSADVFRLSAGTNFGTSASGIWTDTGTQAVQITSALTAATHTYSLYVKADSAITYIQLRVATSSNLFSSTNATFKLSDGSVFGSNGVTASTQSIGNGWYRVAVTWNATAAQWYVGYWFWADSSITTAGTEGVAIWGAQLEASSTPSEYQRITDFSTEFKAAYPTHSLYQDSSGVTPAVSPGDPVALVIDSSRGGLDALGSELVTNGGFDSDTTGWTLTNGTATVSSGQVTLTNGSAGVFATLHQEITTVAGKWYKVACDFIGGNRGVVQVGTTARGFDLGASQAFTSAGQIILFFRASGTRSFVTIVSSNVVGQTGIFDNISVREIPGNHAYVTASGSRPVLARTPDGGRRNLLTYSEQFDNAAWVKTAVSASADQTQAPNGTTTADLITASAGTSGKYVGELNLTFTGQRTYSFYVKYGTHQFVQIMNNGTTQLYANFDIQNGVAGNTGTGMTSSITSVGSGWYRISLTHSVDAAQGVRLYLVDSNTVTWVPNTASTGTFYVWGAQAESGSLSAYQKVGLTSDVTESGKRDCWGLLFDGSDDFLQTASIDFSATDKMTVMAGVRKLSDAADGMLCELTANINTNAGGIYITAPEISSSLSYASNARGTATPATTQRAGIASLAAPHTAVISSTHDISGDLTTLRVNAVAATNATGDKGSGNFANAVLYIGSRGGSSVRYNGLLYTLIIRGVTTTDSTIRGFERLVARRSGVQL